MHKKLTAYQQAVCWTKIETEASYLAKQVRNRKLTEAERLIAVRKCNEKIAHQLLILTHHEVAVAVALQAGFF